MKRNLIIFLLIIFGFTLRGQQPIDIYHYVPFIPQPTEASCWSASIAMILWWRDNSNAQMCMVDALTPAQVAGNLGYWQQYFHDGLDAYDARPFEEFNLVTLQPMSFPVETLAGYLRNGPMWVAYWGCSNPLDTCGHAVVLVGIKGNGTPEGTIVTIHDPDNGTGIYPNLGERDRKMPFMEFVQRLDERALYLLSLPEASSRRVNFLAYPNN